MISKQMLGRLVRYAVVGVLVMGVFTGLNWAFEHFLTKDMAFLAAYPPAVALHYWLNRMWTFASKRTDSGRQLSEYLVMVGATFLVQAAVFKLLTTTTAAPGWLAAGIANAAQMAITFLVMQLRVFRSVAIEPVE